MDNEFNYNKMENGLPNLSPIERIPSLKCDAGIWFSWTVLCTSP